MISIELTNVLERSLKPTMQKLLLILVAAGCMLAGGVLTQTQTQVHAAPALPESPAAKKEEIASLQAEISRLKGVVGDQSHAMVDVGYHFANLWFAGEKKNWPLAKFYLDETRSHLKWAVRINPVRKTRIGDLELKGILDAIDNSILSEVAKSIESKNLETFTLAYRQTLEGCYACHKAAEKPFLRPQIPLTPPQPIMNFDPDAKWPE